MVEPRFKKEMEGKTGSAQDSLKKWKEEIATKKTKYLRLGYTQTPRGKKPATDKRTTKANRSDCPGGKQNCLGCKGANVISPENLVKEQSGAEAIAPLFESAIVERRCCSESGNGCCCAEE